MRPVTVALSLAALMAVPTSALACSCMRQSVADQAKMATAIFTGVPVRTEKLGGFDRVTTFRVVRKLKGSSGANVRIFHFENDGGNCGINFQRGRQIFVTASRIEGKLKTNSCFMPQGSEAEFQAVLSGKQSGRKK